MALTKKPSKLNKVYSDIREAEKNKIQTKDMFNHNTFNGLAKNLRLESSELADLERKLATKLLEGFYQVSNIFCSVGTLYCEDKAHTVRRRIQGKFSRNSEAIVKETYFVYVSFNKPLIPREYSIVNHS